VNYYMDYYSWTFYVGVDTFFVRATLKWTWQTNFRILFKPWIHNMFTFPAVQGNSHQQKNYQIKIKQLYCVVYLVPS
jgi:hypothetical protein